MYLIVYTQDNVLDAKSAEFQIRRRCCIQPEPCSTKTQSNWDSGMRLKQIHLTIGNVPVVAHLSSHF